MIRVLLAFTLLLSSLASGPLLAQSIALDPATPLRVTLQGNSFANTVYIDVPAEAVEMRVTLQAMTADRDVDLLLRKGTPIESSSGGVAPSAEWLIAQGQYRSVSSGGDEYVQVTRSSAIPLAADRWHLGILSFASEPVEVELRVQYATAPSVGTLVVDFNSPGEGCNVAPWNDTTPREPVAGNSGTTLGQQRRNAMLETASLLSQELKPVVGARIRACWDDLGAGDSGLTLAQAGPTGFWLSEQGEGFTGKFLPERYTIYSRAAAVTLAGNDFCRFAGGSCEDGSADLHITFNTRVEDSDTLNGWGFSYGSLRQNLNQADFVFVAMHEIVHGLGFIGLASRSGATDSNPDGMVGDRVFPWDDAYTRYVRYTPEDGPSSGTPLFEVPREDRLTAMTSIDKLRFAGPATSSTFGNIFSFLPEPDKFARLHAPPEIQGGSTLSHFSTEQGFDQLMLAQIPKAGQRQLGLAEALLRDVGWERATREQPVFALPESIQYYDLDRSGHGFDLQKVQGLDNFYFLTLYTFDAQGEPEWFVSVGSIVDGVFLPAPNAFGDSLQRFFYNPDGPPFQLADESVTFNGQIRIDFIDAQLAPICRETRSDLQGTLAVMTWTLDDDEVQQWCVSPIIGESSRAEVDFSNTWYAGPTDSGWGFSVQSFRAGSADGLAFALYYADSQGNPQWAIAQTANYVAGEAIELRRLGGYCRTCPRPAGALPETVVGTVALELFEPGMGTDRVSFDIDQGNGVRFVRSNVPIISANTPRYRGQP